MFKINFLKHGIVAVAYFSRVMFQTLRLYRLTLPQLTKNLAGCCDIDLISYESESTTTRFASNFACYCCTRTPRVNRYCCRFKNHVETFSWYLLSQAEQLFSLFSSAGSSLCWFQLGNQSVYSDKIINRTSSFFICTYP